MSMVSIAKAKDTAMDFDGQIAGVNESALLISPSNPPSADILPTRAVEFKQEAFTEVLSRNAKTLKDEELSMPCFYALVKEFGGEIAAQSCRGTVMTCFYAVTARGFKGDVAARSCRSTVMPCYYAVTAQGFQADVAARSCRGTSMPCFYELTTQGLKGDVAARNCGTGNEKKLEPSLAGAGRVGSTFENLYPEIARSVKFNPEDYQWDSIPCSKKDDKSYTEETLWKIMKQDKNDYYVCDLVTTYEIYWWKCSVSNPHTAPGVCVCAQVQRKYKETLTDKCHWEAKWW